MLRNAATHGFVGELFPVSVRSTFVQGLQAYPSVAALPSVPELVIISVPVTDAIDVLRDCARMGVQGVIMLSALDAGSHEQRDAVAAVCRSYPGTRVLGPSSLGVHGVHAQFAGSFMTATDGDFAFLPSDVFIVSQSGGVGAYMLSAAHAAGFPIGGFISTGVEIDVTLAELLRGIVDHYAPALVCVYLEGSRDGQDLAAALEYAQGHGVPVLALRAGSTNLGREAAERHSGLPGIGDEVWLTDIDPKGVLTVESIEDMVDMGRALAHPILPAGRRLSIVSASGGAGVLMADAAARCGLRLAGWTSEEAFSLARLLPVHASVDNPIDATGAIFSPLRTLGRVLSLCGAHSGTDVVVLSLGNMPHVDGRLFQEISIAAENSDKLIVVVWAGGSPDAILRLAQLGVLAFSDPVRCARALERVLTHPTTAERSAVSLDDDGAHRAS